MVPGNLFYLSRTSQKWGPTSEESQLDGDLGFRSESQVQNEDILVGCGLSGYLIGLKPETEWLDKIYS